MKRVSVISSLLGLLLCFNVSAIEGKTKYVGGYSPITSENYDEWDKKNSAVRDAMKTLTYSLATELMTAEEIEASKELMDKKVVPSANMFILNTEIKDHGLEQEGEFESYVARVKFTYSMNNFKKLLKSKGVLFQNLIEPKVVAFIKVKDKDNLKVYKWWEQDTPRLHPALSPIHKRLSKALEEQGYKFVAPKRYKSAQLLDPKTMAGKAGAHYYISGEVSVSQNKPGGLKLKDGEFYFHETISQKLVSKMNVIDFKKAYRESLRKAPVQQVASDSTEQKMTSRGIASVSNEPTAEKSAPLVPTDLLTDSFRKAVRTMNVVGDPESLTQGLTMITVKGVKNPLELQKVKDSFSSLSLKGLDRFVERSLTQGEVTFIARSKRNISSLKNLIERQTPLKNGKISKSDNKGLIFDYGYSYN